MLKKLFVVLFLAISTFANAARIEKRNADVCVADLNASTNQIENVLLPIVQVWTPSQGYAGVLNFHTKEQTLEVSLNTAFNDCCLTVIYTEAELDEIYEAFDRLVTAIEELIDYIIPKIPQFDAVLLASNIIKTDIKNLRTKITNISNCIGQYPIFVPLIDRLDSAFDRIYLAHHIV